MKTANESDVNKVASIYYRQVGNTVAEADDCHNSSCRPRAHQKLALARPVVFDQLRRIKRRVGRLGARSALWVLSPPGATT